MKLVIIALLIAVAASASAAGATTDAQLKHSTDVVRFFDNHAWMLAKQHEKCWGVPWQKTCRIARSLYEKHTERIANAVISEPSNWTRAMRIANRVFPGTYSWLEFISNRECRACYTTPGAFVCNYEGSGACGPVQFMSETFYGHADDARIAVANRGFRVDPNTWSWRNPLGQALTAAYMRYTHIDGCHWCP